MAIRMSEFDFKRIASAAKKSGLKIIGIEQKKPTAAKKGRIARTVHPGEEIIVLIQMPPRPKERARTFVDMVTTMPKLITAFKTARGDVNKFAALAKTAFSSKTVTPKETRAFEDAVAMAARTAMGGREAFQVPVEMEMTLAFMGEPEAWPTASSDGDLDNLVKAINDGMNGIAFTDDRLVVRSTEEKICAVEPFIRVTIRPARA